MHHILSAVHVNRARNNDRPVSTCSHPYCQIKQMAIEYLMQFQGSQKGSRITLPSDLAKQLCQCPRFYSQSFLTLGFHCGSTGKESACRVQDLGSIPGLGRSPGEGKGYPLQYSGLENSMDCIDHGVAKSQTQQSDFHFHFSLDPPLVKTGTTGLP